MALASRTREFFIHSPVPAYLPFPLASLPYRLAFAIARFFLRHLGCQIWYRNGLAARQVHLGASDVDLTLYFATVPTRERLAIVRQRLTRLKRWLPLLGEACAYCDADILDFQAFANPCELRRDPHLKRRLNKASHSASETDQLTFLLRMLYYDCLARYQIPRSVRAEKWSAYWELATGKPFPDQKKAFLRSTELIDRLDRHYFGRFSSRQIAETLKAYLSQGRLTSPDAWLCRADFQVLFPTIVIGHLHGEARDAFFWRLRNFTSVECELVLAQVEWEIWGTYSHVRLFPPEWPSNPCRRLIPILRILKERDLPELRARVKAARLGIYHLNRLRGNRGA